MANGRKAALWTKRATSHEKRDLGRTWPVPMTQKGGRMLAIVVLVCFAVLVIVWGLAVRVDVKDQRRRGNDPGCRTDSTRFWRSVTGRGGLQLLGPVNGR